MSPKFFLFIGILLFFEFKVHVKFQNPTLSPYGVLIRWREKEREKIMISIMTTSLRWSTHSARTKIGLPTEITPHHFKLTKIEGFQWRKKLGAICRLFKVKKNSFRGLATLLKLYRVFIIIGVCLFLSFRSPWKIWNPMTTPSGILVTMVTRTRCEKISAKHAFRLDQNLWRPRAAYVHSTRSLH